MNTAPKLLPAQDWHERKSPLMQTPLGKCPYKKYTGGKVKIQ